MLLKRLLLTNVVGNGVRLFLVGDLVVTEVLSCKHVNVGVLFLCIGNCGTLRVFDYVLNQLVVVAKRTAKHVVGCIWIWADDTANFQRQTLGFVLVQTFQTALEIAQVVPSVPLLVVALVFENGAVSEIHHFVKGPLFGCCCRWLLVGVYRIDDCLNFLGGL